MRTAIWFGALVIGYELNHGLDNVPWSNAALSFSLVVLAAFFLWDCVSG